MVYNFRIQGAPWAKPVYGHPSEVPWAKPVKLVSVAAMLWDTVSDTGFAHGTSRRRVVKGRVPLALASELALP